MFLGELNQSILSRPGVGAARAKQLGSLGIHGLQHALTHIPREYEDRKHPIPLMNYSEGKPICTVVEVVQHQYFGFGRQRTLKVEVKDNTAKGWLVCFGRNFLDKTLVVGKKFYLFGEFSVKYGTLQCSAFEVEPYGEKKPKLFGAIIPIYPLTEGLSQLQMRKIIIPILDEYKGSFANELPDYIHSQYQLMDKDRAIQTIHRPKNFEEQKEAHRSLAFCELFYLQLIIQKRRAKRETSLLQKKKVTRVLEKKLTDSLPFSLTKDQQSVLKDIREDLSSPPPMGRLVHGEVGSGKTFVALISALYLIEQGYQVAFLAPTDLLAQQHAQGAYKLLEPLGITIAHLAGSVKGAPRKATLQAIASGEAQLIVGTHALFSKDVVMKNLGLVIIDEQQRFGVMQRIALMEKGLSPNLLLMSATPIPRTLAMSIFGDLDVSIIKELPKGRKPIVTHLVGEAKRQHLYGALEKEIERGHQVYFVYPLIEESETLDLKDATAMFEHLNNEVFPHRKVALIHSRIPKDERDELMEEFRKGTIDILVATSVIEIGVDVPNATCMVVEHAERFGLSSLHQLRGRIGRGGDQGYMFLLCPSNPSDNAKERLLAMKELQDGFAIAEKDLEIRGPGEVSGVRQSGFFRLTFADIIKDVKLLEEARNAAITLLQEDPGLLSPKHKVIQEILDRCPPFDDQMLGMF